MEINEIVGYSSLVAAIAAVCSAIVSYRNARLSQLSVEQAQHLALKAERREVVHLATKIAARADFVKNLGESAKQACRSAFISSGAGGSTREKLFMKQIDEKSQIALQHMEDARKFLEISEKIDSKDLDRMHAKFLSHSQVVEHIVAELESLRHQHDQSRREVLRSKGN